MKTSKRTKKDKFVFKITMYDNVKDEKRDEALKQLSLPLNVDDQLTDDEIQEMRQTIEDLEFERDRYKDECESEKERADNLHDKNVTLCDEIDELERKINELEEQLDGRTDAPVLSIVR